MSGLATIGVMVWQRIRSLFAGEEEGETGPTVRDVFRTFAALAAEGVPTPTVIEPSAVSGSYAWGRSELQSYNHRIDRVRSLRNSRVELGWLWFSGSITRNGQRLEYLFPAVTIPIDTDYGSEGDPGHIRVMGDFQLSPLLTDTIARFDLADRLEAEMGFSDVVKHLVSMIGTLQPPDKWVDIIATKSWAKDFAEAMGLGDLELSMENPAHPDQIQKDGITFHPGVALYESRTSTRKKRVYDLTSLDRLPSVIGTAFNALYGTEPTSRSLERPEVTSFRPLSLRQRSIAKKLTDTSLSVLSGAPGTGKTHLISVTAADAVARGESVLVLAGSAKAVDVLVEHFANTPGPPPITFGGSRFGDRISRELVELAAMIDGKKEVDQELIDSAEAHDDRVRRLRHEFEALQLAREFRLDPEARAEMEAELHKVGDLDQVQELVDGTASLSFSSDERRLAKRLGHHEGADEKLRLLRIGEAAVGWNEHTKFSVDQALDDLAANEVNAAQVGGDLLTDHWIGRLGRGDKQVLEAIAKALLVSRYRRGQLLTELDPESLTNAAPIWVGSVHDIEDVLPTIVGLFDLVIIDEASQVDQIAGANALIRSKRALICGDPEQIGFEPFLSEAEVTRAKEACNTTGLPLTPKELSLFDVAAAKFGVEVLDEHFRSAPHVIEFSSRRFYEGGLFTATRHPMNEAADHIDVSIIDGRREEPEEEGGTGVNRAEVDECMAVLESHLERGWESIGMVSPFESQAKAIEERVRERFTVDEITKRGLRVGTVREFQGDECALMIMSYGVSSDEGAAAWEPVNDPKFFNVMATRAREHVHIITSNPSPPGLAGEYVKWAEPLVDLVTDEGSTDPWVTQVAETLRAAGISVRTGYRVGRYVIDIVAGDGEHAVAIDCTLHPDGIDAHIDRALLLRRTGWRTSDAFPEQWQFLLDTLAEDLRERFPEL